MYKVEITVDQETGKIDVTFEPEDEIIMVGLLDAAKDVIKEHCRKKRARHIATAGVRGFGKMDVHKGDGRGASKLKLHPERRKN